jgi:hypothetical protein
VVGGVTVSCGETSCWQAGPVVGDVVTHAGVQPMEASVEISPATVVPVSPIAVALVKHTITVSLLLHAREIAHHTADTAWTSLGPPSISIWSGPLPVHSDFGD